MGGKKEAKDKKMSRKFFRCDQCDKEFAFKSKLKNHFNEVHIGARPFECPECGQTFKQKGDLRRHLKYVHAADEASVLNQCDVCGKVVKHISSHMKIHKEQKQHKCPVCSKEFRWLRDLQRHIRLHTGEKPYYCQFCLKTFRNSSTMKDHERIVHLREKPFQCSICSKTFGSKSNLSRHSKIHSDEKTTTSTAGNVQRNLGVRLTLDESKQLHGLKDCSVVLERIDH